LAPGDRGAVQDCQIFLGTYNVPKREKIDTKLPENVPNGHKMYQMAIEHFPLPGPPKFTQIAIFGLKIYHLATLVQSGGQSKTIKCILLV
jgi:hypothetical protein